MVQDSYKNNNSGVEAQRRLVPEVSSSPDEVPEPS